jgi:hypothetical protein
MRRISLLLLACFVALGLAACANEQQPPQQIVAPNVPTPSGNTSVVAGQIVGKGNKTPIKKTPVYLAKVFWDQDHKQAAFALDLANSPVGHTDQNGYFWIAQVEPFEYVIVVGDYYGNNEAIRENNGDARVFKAEAGQTLNIGSVEVSPTVQVP